MSSLGRRWEYVAGQVEKRVAEHKRKAAMAAPVVSPSPTAATSKIPRYSLPSASAAPPPKSPASTLSAKERFFAASPPVQPKLNLSQKPPLEAMSAKERFFSSTAPMTSTTTTSTATTPVASSAPTSVNGDKSSSLSTALPKMSARVTDLDSEEVIDTLPEEGPIPQSNNVRDVEAESSLLSSKDSSLGGSAVDLEVVTGQVIIKSNSPTFIKETVSLIPKSPTRISQKSPTTSATSPMKTPPKTFPKPTWFTLEGAAPPAPPPLKSLSSIASTDTPTSSSSSASASKSKAVSDATTKDLELSRISDGEPSVEGGGDEGGRLSEDERLANENSAIERILNEANADLAEVVGKRKMQYDFQSKKAATAAATEERNSRESKEFEENVSAMLAKIERAKSKLDELDQESDLKLRQDLIGMESKMIEAEVATLISRGDTLVLLTHRYDVVKADSLQEKVRDLRREWQGLKATAEDKRDTTLRFEESVKKFVFEVDRLKIWMAEKILKMDGIDFGEDETQMRQLAIEIENRTPDVKRLADVARKLQDDHALGSHASAWRDLYCQWEELVGKAKKYYRDRIEKNLVASPTRSTATSKSGESGGSDVSQAESGCSAATSGAKEIISRIGSMREAVAAIDKQFNTHVLSSSKHYENLEEQEEALTTANLALERLRPTIKKTAKDLEVMTGALSVEYLEKIVALSERLRDEWQQVNKRYKERHQTWKKCHEKRARYSRLIKELAEWMEEAERTLAHAKATAGADRSDKSKLTEALEEQKQIERQVSERNKEVTDLAVIGKEMMNRSSAQEHLDVQAQVDRVLKRWKAILSQLSAQREKFNKERFVNNIHYIGQWIDEAMERMGEDVNASVASDINKALNLLQTFEEQHKEKTAQMEKLTSSRHCSSSAEAVEKLSRRFQRLTSAMRKRRRDLQDKWARLESVSSRLASGDAWVTQTLVQMDSWKGSPEKMGLMRRSVKEKEKELVEKLFEDYEALTQDVTAVKMRIDREVESQMGQFRTNWFRLAADCRKEYTKVSSPKTIVKETSLSRSRLQSQKSSSSAAAKSPTTSSSSVKSYGPHPRAPELYSTIRDHKDWVRMKRGLIQALALSGTLGSVQRQAEEHHELK